MAIIDKPAPAEEVAITKLVTAAFGQPDEALLVERLRAAGRLGCELVAREDDILVGHIAFSAVGIGAAEGDGRWLALAPLAVAPPARGRGVGAALVRAGLEAAWRASATLVIVLGEPGYYGRFGFRAAGELDLICPYPAPPECFMAIARGAPPPAGTVRYAPEFGGP